MKQRVREAVFNLLGPRVAGRHVVDLFAGTGALTWEALSRGADSAVLLEQHFPTARLLRENAQTLGLDQRIHTIAGDTFHWARRLDPASPPGPRDRPWLVFCSPPYEFFVSKRDEMLELIERMIRIAVPRSLIVVESDGRLPVTSLPPGVDWDRREYPPAVVAIGYCTDDM
jgi:16S rRNA (guanine966-N2)-methyltransferase